MQTDVLEIYKDQAVSYQPESYLSFRPFVRYLKSRLKQENSVKTEFYRFVIDKFEDKKIADARLDVGDSAGYKELMDMIYMILTPPVMSEKEQFWALSSPVSGNIIYSTDSFYKFLAARNTTEKNIQFSSDHSYSRQQILFIYRLILERFYNIPSVGENEIVYTSSDARSGLPKFYRVHTDTQFIDIAIKGKLPELHYPELERFLQEGEGIKELGQLLPLSLFRFEGFSVITLTDITLQRALESIRNALVAQVEGSEQCSNEVFQALKILAQDADIEFGLLPFLEVNGKPVFLHEKCSRSMCMNSAEKIGLTEETFNTLVREYRHNPKSVVFNNLSEEKHLRHPFLKGLRNAGVYSYAVLPAYYNKQLTGILEVYSKKEIILDEKLFSPIQVAMPLIAQLLKQSADDFDARIKDIVREKFTSLQSSVLWKFNDVAWKVLEQQHAGVKSPVIGTVRFRDLYPFYGAVDVRNSTTELNKAVYEDMKKQLSLLEDALAGIKAVTSNSSTDQFILQCGGRKDEISNYYATRDEIALHRFLESEVHPFLLQVKQDNPAAAAIIANYFDAITEGSGVTFQNRRELEDSLQMINHELNGYFETAQQALQQIFPVYFEKFRTDGVEYDIYAGQSIAPGRPFDHSVITELRKWQVRSMAEIAGLMQKLLPGMPRPLQTTQLIFIHPDPIDISFRIDERRFDVEGAYNIRYEVIKKRIDKVRTKDTQERLTQPGRIAMVYFNQADAEEYAKYIRDLQEEGLLENDLEYLDLEELQGVTGLKAMRVGVKGVGMKSEE